MLFFFSNHCRGLISHTLFLFLFLLTSYPSIHPSIFFLPPAGNTRNETRFAEDDGLDTLFEFLEVSPFVLRLPIMRILSDLLANNDLVPFVR